METNVHELHGFLESQLRDFGAHLEIEDGLWALFAVPAADPAANALVRSLLADVKFAHQAGPSEDDQWQLYYVDGENRELAAHWLADLVAVETGRIRPASPGQEALVGQLATADRPHLVARELADQHARGKASAGLVRQPGEVRPLLDRLHVREPLFYSALQTLLENHLVDMVVLLRQLITEDVALINEIVKAGLSRDPFLQARQDATAAMRAVLTRFCVINPLDQQKSTGRANPYAAFLEVATEAGQVMALVNGINLTLPQATVVDAIHSVRRNLYQGKPFSSFNTQAPWMTEELAPAFRFIKQQADSHRDLAPLDVLYMLERSLEA